MNYMPTIQVRKIDKLVRSDNTADKTENIWFKKMKIVDELKFLAAVRAVYAGDILHGKYKNPLPGACLRAESSTRLHTM